MSPAAAIAMGWALWKLGAPWWVWVFFAIATLAWLADQKDEEK